MVLMSSNKSSVNQEVGSSGKLYSSLPWSNLCERATASVLLFGDINVYYFLCRLLSFKRRLVTLVCISQKRRLLEWDHTCVSAVANDAIWRSENRRAGRGRGQRHWLLRVLSDSHTAFGLLLLGWRQYFSVLYLGFKATLYPEKGLGMTTPLWHLWTWPWVMRNLRFALGSQKKVIQLNT